MVDLIQDAATYSIIGKMGFLESLLKADSIPVQYTLSNFVQIHTIVYIYINN